MRSDEEKKASEEAVCRACQFNAGRRAWLGTAAGIGVLARAGMFSLLGGGLLWPERTEAHATTVEYDLARLPPGQVDQVEWMAKPVWIIHRTPAMLDGLKHNDRRLLDPDSRYSVQPANARNEGRSIRPEYFVCFGVCTHMGCPLNPKPVSGVSSGLGEDWAGGFLCLCHGSRFDLAGRVYEGVPATANLEVPPYFFVGDQRLVIGQALSRKS